MSANDLENEIGDLRQLLFLYYRPTEHRMPFKSGGEMQCGDVDLERDPIEKLSAYLDSK